MPELPEIQAHAERLTREFSGAVLERFEPISFTALKTALPDPSGATGRPLGRIGRRGKHLIMDFGHTAGIGADTSGEPGDPGDSGDPHSARLSFVVHLMQAGRLVPDDKLSRRPRNGIARWRFVDHAALLLTEAGTERKAGVWTIEGDPLVQAPLEGLGPDADAVSAEQFATVVAQHNQRVHGFLRDQHGVAGLGRMLANEICHRAKLSPFAMTAKFDDDDVTALYEAMDACIADALRFERSLDAMSKTAERPGAVHRRKGEMCPVCGDTIRAVEYNAYEVDYCPTCQTGGKVLADNKTSKFLK